MYTSGVSSSSALLEMREEPACHHQLVACCLAVCTQFISTNCGAIRRFSELLQPVRHRLIGFLAALLAVAPYALVRADARPPALLAPAPLALVRADARPPHSLHLLLSRWCWQRPAPPHSLHLLLSRPCGQMLRAFLRAAPSAVSSHRRRLPPPPAGSGAAARAALSPAALASAAALRAPPAASAMPSC